MSPPGIERARWRFAELARYSQSNYCGYTAIARELELEKFIGNLKLHFKMALCSCDRPTSLNPERPAMRSEPGLLCLSQQPLAG